MHAAEHTRTCKDAYTLSVHARTHAHHLRNTHTHLSNEFAVGTWLARITLIVHVSRTAERENPRAGVGEGERRGERR